MYTDRNLNNYFSGVRKPQLNVSNVTSTNATFKNTLIENKLQTNGDVKFNSSLIVNDDIDTLTGDIRSAGSIYATTSLTSGKYVSSGVVTVPLYNTGGGANAYNSLNSSADAFIDSTKGNIFTITGPSGSSLANIYLYFNTSPDIPGNVATVNGTIMTILLNNSTSRSVTVHLNLGPIVKGTSDTIIIPSGTRSNIVFTGYSNIITEISRSGSMTS
jgi:hypothetical protein